MTELSFFEDELLTWFPNNLIMGIKGDKMTNDSILNAELLVEKLSSLGAVTSKKMIGGYGIFYEIKMFEMVVSKGIAFFKVDTILKADFASQGSEAHAKMPYTSIPESIFNDLDLLQIWA